MANWTQDNRHIAINTPLGKDVLLLKSINFKDEISRPFVGELELRSQKAGINFNDIVGQNVTIRVNRTNGEPRYFNGYISRFVQEGDPVEGSANHYRATLVPWLWLLTRTADCRIFQNKNIPDIVKEVFTEQHFDNFEFRLTATYKPREFVVQYRETAFNFVSRLLEHEGIFYFFEHSNGKHVLVLADSPAREPTVPGYEKVTYNATTTRNLGMERVWDWIVEKGVQPGKFALIDFDPKAPTKNLYVERAAPAGHANADYEVYDYPGTYLEHADGETYVAIRSDEQAAQHAAARAIGDVRGLFAGAKFKLESHPREDQNTDHLVTVSQVYASTDEYGSGGSGASANAFRTSFTTMPASMPFRPARKTSKPRVAGPQTAIVVAPSAEEIYTDADGRVKVHFHWDRRGKQDENASCWIRVSQQWAGKKWGGFFLPRKGQEVIVDFLEGDPDCPIITGRVHNNDNMPPYALPGEKTKSTWKSNSSKGGEGYNELRFEDKKGSEQIFIHAEGRMDVRIKKSLYETMGGNREIRVGYEDAGDHNSYVHHDENVILKHNRFEKMDDEKHLIVGKDVIEKFDKNHYEMVKETYQLNANKIVIEAKDAMAVGAKTIALTGSDKVDVKSGAVKVEGTQSIDVKTTSLKLTASGVNDVKGGTVNVEGGQEVHIKGGMKVCIEGGMQVCLKGPGGFVAIGPGGVDIQGTMVKINSGGAAASAGSAGSAQSAAEAEHAQAVTVLEPIEAYAAQNSTTGQASGGGGGGWSPGGRSHRPIRIDPQPRPPVPPPPGPQPGPGGGGGPGTTTPDYELVELVEVQKNSGVDVDKQPQARKQYVNLPLDDAKPEQGRKIRFRARIRWKDGSTERSLAGKPVKWYIQAPAANRQNMSPASLKAGYDSDGGPVRKDTTTNADGWTPIVEFHPSQYGGDEFTVAATLDAGYTGGLTAGAYTVWRRLFYEKDCMNRVGGGTFSNVVNENGIKSEFARNFVEIVRVGTDSTPAYKRVLMSDECRTFARNIRQGGGLPNRYFHLIYVDTIAQRFEQAVPAGNGNMRFALTMRRPGVANDNKFALTVAGNDCIDKDNWFRSCEWTQPSTGQSGTLTQDKCVLVERPDYATANDGWDVTVDLTGVGDEAQSVDVTLRYKNMDELSGLNTGIETIVGLRFRETANGVASANSIASCQRTSTHEPGHAMGMVATTMPDGTAHPTVITTQGTHCTFNTDQCCMFRAATNFVTTFCPNCHDALRGRKLESIPLDGPDPYT